MGVGAAEERTPELRRGRKEALQVGHWLPLATVPGPVWVAVLARPLQLTADRCKGGPAAPAKLQWWIGSDLALLGGLEGEGKESLAECGDKQTTEGTSRKGQS